jgi:uroporphyrinogen-III synthase
MILYLGIDPSRWKTKKNLLHYPVIKTELIAEPDWIDWPFFTHLLFTSRSAVLHWKRFEEKKIIAIGTATAALLRNYGCHPLVASESTQEGVIELLKRLDLSNAYLAWPRSERARNILVPFLSSLAPPFRFVALDLYKTVFQRLEPVPSLEEIEEIVFTSPSTVEGFLQIYGQIPQNKKITAIGPVTQDALLRYKRDLF